MKCSYINLGNVAEVSQVDGVHFGENSQDAIAVAVADRIKSLTLIPVD